MRFCPNELLFIKNSYSAKWSQGHDRAKRVFKSGTAGKLFGQKFLPMASSDSAAGISNFPEAVTVLSFQALYAIHCPPVSFTNLNQRKESLGKPRFEALSLWTLYMGEDTRARGPRRSYYNVQRDSASNANFSFNVFSDCFVATHHLLPIATRLFLENLL